MLEVFVLLFICTMLALLYKRSCYVYEYEENGNLFLARQGTTSSRFVIFVLLLVMVCYAGLRTRMNDSTIYITAFETRVPNSFSNISEMDWSLGSNPGFFIYEVVIRTLFTQSGYGFLFITSLLVVTSMVMFLKKYSVDFSFSIFIFISFTVYAFTMAAMKQTMATAIAIWSIPLYLNGKKVYSVLLILFAMMIHPYVAIYFFIFFMSDGIWNKKIIAMIVIAIFAGFSFTAIIERAISVASLLGDEYDFSYFYGSGISRSRLLVYMIAPVLTFLNRNAIRQQGNRFDFLCINLSTLSMCFMIFASFGGANMIGRVANYFDIFSCFSIATAFAYWENEIYNRQIIKFIAVIAFLVFYYTYYSKYAVAWEVPWNGCFYEHISIFNLLSKW